MAGERTALAADGLMLFLKGFNQFLRQADERGSWDEETLVTLATLAEAFNKVVRSMGRAAPELTALAVAGDVVRELADIVRSDHPGLVADLEPILQKLVSRLGGKYGA